MALEEFGEGKCVNCGFLGKRDRGLAVSACYEANIHERQQGNLTGSGYGRTHAWCFVREFSIGDEIVEIGGNHDTYNKVQDILNKDRNCPSWCKWTEFITPKEHYEEYKMRQLELDRRKFEQQIETDRRKFELELQRLNEIERKRTDKVMIAISIVGVFLALAQIFTATPDSIIFKWFR